MSKETGCTSLYVNFTYTIYSLGLNHWSMLLTGCTSLYVNFTYTIYSLGVNHWSMLLASEIIFLTIPLNYF